MERYTVELINSLVISSIFEVQGGGTFQMEITYSPTEYEEQASITIEIIDADPDPDSDPVVFVSIQAQGVGGQFLMLPSGSGGEDESSMFIPQDEDQQQQQLAPIEESDQIAAESEPQLPISRPGTAVPVISPRAPSTPSERMSSAARTATPTTSTKPTTPTAPISREKTPAQAVEPLPSRRPSIRPSVATRRPSTRRPSREGTPTEAEEVSTDLISVIFGEVLEYSKTRKQFEIENAGDTIIDLGVYTPDGEEWPTATDVETVMAKYHVEPVLAKIQPKTKQVFYVQIRGKQPGDAELEFSVRTRSLKNNRAVPVRAVAKIMPKTDSDGIRSFARADEAIQNKLSADTLEEEGLESDRGLWKLLRYVVRLGEGKPSEEFANVDFVEVCVLLFPIARRIGIQRI